MARDFELPDEVNLHYFLYCVDLKSGKVSWKQEYHTGKPQGGRHRKNSFTSETPVTDGKLVYVYATSLGLWAYDMKGKQVWKTPLENYPMYGDFGTGASPALAGDLLIICNDNEKQQFIAAFDKKTGKQVWRTDRDLRTGTSAAARRSGWSTPFVWVTPGRTEIVTIGPGFAVSYDLQGKELWKLAGMGGGPIPSPYAWGGLLLLNGGAGGPITAVKPGATGAFSVAPKAESSDHVAWSIERAGTYLPTQLAYDGAIYSLSDTGILSRYEDRQAQLPLAHRERRRVHLVAVGLRRQGLLHERGGEDVRDRGRREVRAAEGERPGGVRAGDAGAGRRPPAAAHRERALFDQGEEVGLKAQGSGLRPRPPAGTGEPGADRVGAKGDLRGPPSGARSRRTGPRLVSHGRPTAPAFPTSPAE